MQRRQALSILGAGAAAFGAYRYFGNAGMAARGVAWPPGLQPELRRGDFPNGDRGWHTVDVAVAAS